MGNDAARPSAVAFASTQALTPRELLSAPVRWPRPSRLERELKAPGKRISAGLRTLGLETVGDLLEHLPSDSREARTVGALAAAEQATVAVQVRSISARPVRRRGMRPLVEAVVFDATGSMRATFFNQPWLVDRYPPGTRLLLHGKADGRGRFNVSHHAPAQTGIGEASEEQPPAGQSVAHYPASEGVTSTQILTLVQSERPALGDVVEILSAKARAAEHLPDRASALAAMHFPRDARDPEVGRRRLAYEELLLMQLLFLRRRAQRRARAGAIALAEPPSLSARWREQALPFALTGDQERAIAKIDEDLAHPRPMQRLLMGEVGSGKTVVALHAMLRAVEHGHQAALMAPTETLAEQHFATLQALLGGESVSAALLTGATPARRRSDILAKLASGELSLVVGTHALIEPDVVFRSLALAVIDEQHRFGVRQRERLVQGRQGAPAGSAARSDPGETVHTLHMTATPIPRTLSLARYGDVDTSALHELPSGRRPVRTSIVGGEAERAAAYRAPSRGAGEGAPGLRRLPADRGGPRRRGCRRAGGGRGRWARGAARGHRRAGAAPRGRTGGLHAGASAWRDAPAREAGGDGGVRLGARPGAGVDDRDRGRHRRAERDRDGDRERRALRDLPAAPAARPGRDEASTAPPASWSARRARPGCVRSWRTPTASGSPTSTSSCAARVS